MSINQYRKGLRSATRGLWNGSLDRRQFRSAMNGVIDRRLFQAWLEGAAECGIDAADLTVDEQADLAKAIREEQSNVPAFADRIQENSKVNKGKLIPLLDRINNLWVNRYRDLRNQAKTIACKDKKFIWKLGATEVHCSTCPKLDGKVKRGSVWTKAGIRPQNPPNSAIECGGWNCLCELLPTNKPVSKGPLPRFR